MEPVLTQNISSNDLCKFIDKPMSELPEFTTHTQSVERIVKEVTRASEHFSNKDRRNGLIRSTLEHRKLMPKFLTKSHYYLD